MPVVPETEEKQGAFAPDSPKKRKLIPRQLRYIIATAIVLLSLLGISAGFVLRVYFMTESACYDTLAVETENAIDSLETHLRNDRTMLRVIAGMIGNNGDMDSIEVSGYLTNYDINAVITQIGILLPDDTLISSRVRLSSGDASMNFDAESHLGEHICGSQLTGSTSSTTMIRNYVPIRVDGICTGVLFSEARSAAIIKAWLPSIYDKNGFCYVVDRKTGAVILNTASDAITDIHDIPFTQTNASYTKEGTVSNILDGKKGYSVFRSPAVSETLYMCYLPFSVEDWEMVVFVPESAVFSAVQPIRTGMYFMFGISAILVILYALFLFHEIRASVAETEQKANTDVLTGLQNRNCYEAYLKKIENSKERMVCLFIDVNGLHELNNTKGHYAGDQMLRFIADTLKIRFGGEHIYRIGGDEFVVFQSDKSESEINECLAEFHETLLRNDYHAAVGSCVYEPGMNVAQLIVNAEKKMYDAKKKYYEQIGKVMRV